MRAKAGLQPEEIVRVPVFRQGKRTSVSMDAFLADEMAKRLGNDQVFRNWVAATVEAFDAEWMAKAGDLRDGERVRIRAGVSRMVQREALRALLK